MKTILNYTISLLFIQLSLVSCLDEEIDLTDKDTFIKSVTGTWAIEEGAIVKLNDLDITNALKDFEITINEDLSYTSNSNDLELQPFPWPSSGSFTVNDDLTQFTRDDGLNIIVFIDGTETEITMNFLADENTNTTGGRVKDIATGKWEFGLKRKK